MDFRSTMSKLGQEAVKQSSKTFAIFAKDIIKE